MDIQTVVKAATLVSVGCSVVLTGVAAYSAYQQKRLNDTINAGMQKITEGESLMKNWHRTSPQQ